MDFDKLLAFANTQQKDAGNKVIFDMCCSFVCVHFLESCPGLGMATLLILFSKAFFLGLAPIYFESGIQLGPHRVFSCFGFDEENIDCSPQSDQLPSRAHCEGRDSGHT